MPFTTRPFRQKGSFGWCDINGYDRETKKVDTHYKTTNLMRGAILLGMD